MQNYIGKHSWRRIVSNWASNLDKFIAPSDVRWDLSVDNKLLLYKQILKPVWTYGIPLWGCTKKNLINRLGVIADTFSEFLFSWNLKDIGVLSTIHNLINRWSRVSINDKVYNGRVKLETEPNEESIERMLRIMMMIYSSLYNPTQ